MEKVLETELKTYERERERLLEECEGKYVLIYGDQVVGAFDTEMDAITVGYQKFGNVPLLVKQVLRIETPLEFVSGYING